MSFTEKYGEEIYTIKKYMIRGLIILTLILLINGTIKKVPAGYVGILYNNLQGGIQLEEFNSGKEGIWFKLPFIHQLKYIPITEQSVIIDNSNWARDINNIPFGAYIIIKYNLQPSQAAELVKMKGFNYDEEIKSITQAEGVALFSGYNQENLSQESSKLSLQLKTRVQERLDNQMEIKLKEEYIKIISVDLQRIYLFTEIERRISDSEARKNQLEQQKFEFEYSQLGLNRALSETETNKKRIELETETIAITEKQKIDTAAYKLQKEAESKAEAIRQIANAYREVPPEYLIAKAYESIKPTDKIVIGMDSLSKPQNLITISYKDLIEYLNQTEVVKSETNNE